MTVNKDDKKSLWIRTLDISQNKLKQFAQLWSLQTLTDLPDRLRNLWQQLIVQLLSDNSSTLFHI